MNKNQQKMVAYGRLIDTVMTRVEEIQDKLNPEFETLRTAIDADKVGEIKADEYAAIQKDFAAGTADYASLRDQLAAATVPARLIGNHKLMVKAFAAFVDGCQAMTDSLGADQTIDVAAFNAAEADQDEQTELITKYLQKIQVLA